MKKLFVFSVFLALAGFLFSQNTDMQNSIHQFEMTSITGEKVSLSKYAGHPVLIVNVASECGLTPQYADLQELYDEFKDQGLVILGFPANNFGAQEPGSNEQIQQFCSKNFGVTFPMFAKISVKGEDIHPLYDFLTDGEKNGVHTGEIKWNFQKFLVDGEGKVVKSISPMTTVKDETVLSDIKNLLK